MKTKSSSRTPQEIRETMLALLQKLAPLDSLIITEFKTGREVWSRVKTYCADGNGNGWIIPKRGRSVQHSIAVLEAR